MTAENITSLAQFLNSMQQDTGAKLTISFIVFAAIVYIYQAMAWYKILKQKKYKNPWLAFIPIVNMVPILEIGGFKWGWIFLILVPIVGWIALIVLIAIAFWRITESYNYPGFFSLTYIFGLLSIVFSILYMVLIGFMAWKKPAKKMPKKPAKKIVKKLAKKTTKKVVTKKMTKKKVVRKAKK